jgi:predicted nucleotidyltransferase
MQKAFLEALAKSGIAKITGSYARNEQTATSDIDFQVTTPRSCVLYGGRNENITKVIELLERHGIAWNSTRTGYISTIGEKNNIEIEMEFYDCFERSRVKVPEVTIMNATFKTY